MLMIALGLLFTAGLIAKVHDLTKQNQALQTENQMLWLSNNRLSWDVERAHSELELTCIEYDIPSYTKFRRVKHVDATRH